MPKKFIKIFLSYILPLAAGISLFYFLVLPNIDFKTMKKLFHPSNALWISLSTLFALTSHWSRGYRSKMMLEPLNYKVGWFESTLAVLIGYFANLFLPRAGEILRPGVMQKMEKVPSGVTFGTVITERIIDLILLFILVILVLVLEFKRINNILFGYINDKMDVLLANERMLYLFIGGCLLGILIIVLPIFLLRKKIKAFFNTRLGSLVKEITKGMRSIRGIRNKPAFLFHTLLIWTMYYLMAYVLFFCIPETRLITPVQGLVILVMGGIANATPIQGGIGAYNLLVGATLATYAITKDPQQNEMLSHTVSTFMLIIQNLVIIVFGGIAFIISLFISKKEPSLVFPVNEHEPLQK